MFDAQEAENNLVTELRLLGVEEFYGKWFKIGNGRKKFKIKAVNRNPKNNLVIVDEAGKTFTFASVGLKQVCVIVD